MSDVGEQIDTDLEQDDASMDEDWSIFVSHSEVAQTKQLLAAHRTDLATVAGITPAELDAVYAKGMELMRAGLFVQAGRVFFGLVTLKPFEARFYRAVGMAYHHRRMFRWSRIIYGQALAYDPQDRIAMALRAECTLLILGKVEAQKELADLLAMGSRDKSDLPYLERAKALMSKLSVVARRAI